MKSVFHWCGEGLNTGLVGGYMCQKRHATHETVIDGTVEEAPVNAVVA